MSAKQTFNQQVIADEKQAQKVVDNEAPRYSLSETCYIDDVLYQVRPGVANPEISFSGVPGRYMVPLNAAAKAMVEKHPPREANLDKLLSAPVTK